MVLKTFEKIGVVAAFIPFVSAIPGLIKAYVYYNKAKGKNSNKEAEEIASKADGVAAKQLRVHQEEKECYKKLWKYSIAEAIPGVNFFAAYYSKTVLDKLSELRELEGNSDQEEAHISKSYQEVPSNDSEQEVLLSESDQEEALLFAKYGIEKSSFQEQNEIIFNALALLDFQEAFGSELSKSEQNEIKKSLARYIERASGEDEVKLLKSAIKEFLEDLEKEKELPKSVRGNFLINENSTPEEDWKALLAMVKKLQASELYVNLENVKNSDRVEAFSITDDKKESEDISLRTVFNDELAIKRCTKDCNFKVSETQKEEYVELMIGTPEEDIGESWKKYVIFKDPKVAVSLKYDPDQKRYGNWMHQTIKIAADSIRKKDWDFDGLLGFLTCSRRYIANNPWYGSDRPRNWFDKTILIGPYAGIYDFYKTYSPDGVSCQKQDGMFTITGTIKGEKIPLSTIMIDDELGVRTLFHTETVHIKEIMDYVQNDLYPEALRESDRENLSKVLGKIFWWICQAKPWHYGDPSIAETLIRTIWSLKGFEQPEWAEGVIPWVEVINEPDVEKFSDNFHKLFKRFSY